MLQSSDSFHLVNEDDQDIDIEIDSNISMSIMYNSNFFNAKLPSLSAN